MTLFYILAECDKGEDMTKLINFDDIGGLVKDKARVAVSGFFASASPEEVLEAIRDSFLKKGYPKNLKIMHGPGSGNADGTGIDRLALPGLIDEIIISHLATLKETSKLIADNKIKCYDLPYGTILRLYDSAIRSENFMLTKLGLSTFVDPRLDGGRFNTLTKDVLGEIVTVLKEEFIAYKTPKIDLGLIRGTRADIFGNISIEDEIGPLDLLQIAMASKNSGGKVICQVKEVIDEKLSPDKISIPGNLVDYVFVTSKAEKYHRQTWDYLNEDSLSGKINIELSSKNPLPLNMKKVIARRAALEIKKDSIVNMGVGVPELVADICDEEGIKDKITLTQDSGVLGGLPLKGGSFGAALNSKGAMPSKDFLDFTAGGGIETSFLGLAEVDGFGNLNVSRFENSMPGCGGFIDIAQGTKNLVFCGSLTAGGLKVEIKDGELQIVQEGKIKKFVKSIFQRTFSAKSALENGQNVIYVTERCVFRLSPKGLILEEIAPGVDLERDILKNIEFEPLISDQLKIMDSRIFSPEKMHL